MPPLIFANQDNPGFDEYRHNLLVMAALSKLYTEEKIPYLHYRSIEKLFCQAFKAEDLSRTDISFDARKDSLGVGLKTFGLPRQANRQTSKKTEAIKSEKIAEFNKNSEAIRGASTEEGMIAALVSSYNQRVSSALTEYKIEKAVFHCVLRYWDDDHKGNLLLKEYPYELIGEIEGVHSKSDKTLNFDSNGISYSYHLSKSTLFRRFDASLSTGLVVPVDEVPDIQAKLQDCYRTWVRTPSGLVVPATPRVSPEVTHVILPLYSSASQTKKVPERSGLNHWNANGRKRTFGEMYIGIPAIIRHKLKGFFPEQGTEITILTADNTVIPAAICQENGKAIMSNPNTSLAKWVISVITNNEQRLITYDDLATIGKDAAKLEKINGANSYRLTLAPIGSWEEFKTSILDNIPENGDSHTTPG